jgi:hypothetical protein
MPLKLGNTNIANIYKGETKIGKIYKGTTLVYSSAIWLPYSYEYLLNSLVPTTIDNHNVLNQAKIIKLYGNGCVVNQLCVIPTITSQTLNGITLTNNGDGSLTLSGTATAQTTFTVMGNLSRNIPLGHKVFITNFKTPNSTTYFLQDAYDTNVTSNLINTPLGYIKSKEGSNTIISPRIYIKSGATINETIFIMYFDLSHSYGLGDEPTSINDNRIQTILNRGYIPHNTGEYVGTDISEIVSEPYNLFDGTASIENAYLYNTGGQTYDSDCNISDFIKIVGGKTYTLENIQYSNPSLCFYDEDKNYISGTNYLGATTKDFVAPNNAVYCRFTIVKAKQNITCFHLTGTRTGYAPYQEPITIPFKAQLNGAINSHDTLEITNSAYVFEKNTHYVDFSNESSSNWVVGFENQGTNYERVRVYSRNILNNTTLTSSTVNCLSTYLTASSNNNTYSHTADKIISQTKTQTGSTTFTLAFYIWNSAYSSMTTTDIFNDLVSNKMRVQYTLATPQTISIPRKHLGILPLSQVAESSFYPATSTNQRSEVIASGLPNCVAIADNQTPNAYMKDYNVDTPNATYIFTNGIFTIKQYDINRIDFYICDNNIVGMTKAQMKEYLSNYLVFYETQDEVDDIVDKIGIEAGGSLSANEFSYTENQLLNFNTATQTENGITKSFSNNSFSIVGTTTSSSWIELGSYKCETNHKYFIMTNYDTSSLSGVYFYSLLGVIRNTSIITASSSSANDTFYFVSTNTSLAINQNIQINIVDLTIAFGSGNEPATITDKEIQYLINKGYIAYNPDGTLVSVSPLALLNLDTKIKGK